MTDRAAATGRILVAYGSWAGSTAEIAAEIGKVLGSDGTQVDVVAAGQVSDLLPYAAVVVGSAIRARKCKPEVFAFAQQHQEALQRLPVALFGVGTYPRPDSAAHRTQAESFIAPLREMLRPVALTAFSGAVIADRLAFPFSLIVKTQPQGDWRDWDAIRSWAESLRPLLANDRPA